MAVLPEAVLLLEILARLPLDELLRLRCVCRSWSAATSDPLFISRHEEFQRRTNTRASFLVCGSPKGTFLLNPRKHRNTWSRPEALSCPTNPAGVLVGASGGLLCYAIISRYVVFDFVVWNPVTNQCRHIPTFFHSGGASTALLVTMVLSDEGCLQQIWVNFRTYVAIYDCFISKEAMKRRVASGCTVLGCNNLWMALNIKCVRGRGTMVNLGSKMLLPFSKTVVDIGDFSSSTVTRDLPVGFGEWGFVWDILDYCQEATGRLLCYSIQRSGLRFMVCEVRLVHDSAGLLRERHEPLWIISTSVPRCYSPLRTCHVSMASVVDKLYMASVLEEQDALLDVHSVNNTTDEDEAMRVEDGEMIERPFPEPQPLVLEPSFTDSPGRHLQGGLSWDMLDEETVIPRRFFGSLYRSNRMFY